MSESDSNIKSGLSTTEFVPGLVSVVVPNYNHGRYLGDAIESILAQTYRQYEIIVVDDGSTDNSRKVAAEYGDQIRYIYKDNAGLSAARNTGLRHAQGEFIALLDADDMYEPDFMERLVHILSANDNVDGVYCGYRFVDQYGVALPQAETRVIPSEQLYEVMKRGNFWVPESVMMRRSCYITAGPYDESLRACEDWDIWLRILAKHSVMGIADILTRHRILPNSMSSDPTRMVQNRLAVTRNHFGTLSQPTVQAGDKISEIYGQAYLVSSIEYLQFGDVEKAFFYFKQAAEASPCLLNKAGTFYELGCGSQPKGGRGDLMNIDLESNGNQLLDFLSRLFDESNELEGVDQEKVVGLAQYTLGVIGYNSGRNKQARRYFHQAIKHDKNLLTSADYGRLYLRTLINPSLIDFLKSIKN